MRSRSRAKDAGARGSGQAAVKPKVTPHKRFVQRARRVRLRVWRLVAWLLLVVGVAGGVYWLLTQSDWFRVDQVTIGGASAHRETIIRDRTQSLLGQPLVEVDLAEARDAVDQVHLFSAVRVRRAWPNGVHVEVSERTPVAAAALPSGAYRLIDKAGVGYESVPAPPAGVLPVKIANPRDSRSLATAAAVGTSMPAGLVARVKNFEVDGSARGSFELSGVRVMWGDSSEGRVKAAVLEPLMRRGKISTLDLSAPLSPVTTR
ncbi:FtsQ-type POTRA domain-containing protein [Dermatophilus congolensis]|uniref:FtsQ-type POTRA domain-containing protein n=1 Tax=Dermatophilus congolensis TaxID=1863 RepID=UPI001AAF6F69|nr:FtsQ-type POTRA domain-containing protein [Dermatophilus congolensis]MBO3151334.1 FtsQ-type POTRA domain-containing protein [Dermatophilus congolensis]MBO3161662.1 FtsQ-type POTRA domain-containing protein [Dermatophilus congolensis]MBO3162620.1 FtsQ-type POTRA domain-containing protein [Dermatophilus congolensis]MBO3176173.1 FtsQ-type POTRA domain-containing protein [Dermatophilus congolensis]